MRILVTGGGGMVGQAVSERLTALGHQIVRLLRPASQASPGRQGGDGHSGLGDRPAAAWWDIPAGRIDLSGAGPLDAVIHLAGESLPGLWTRRKRERILASRRTGNRHPQGKSTRGKRFENFTRNSPRRRPKGMSRTR
mgnify:CR=1 FL=1